MTDAHDAAEHETGADVEVKDKNLQLKVTATYQKAVQALAKAKGHKNVAEYIQALLDKEIEDAEIDDLGRGIEQRKAHEADQEKAYLRTVLSEAKSGRAVRPNSAAS